MASLQINNFKGMSMTQGLWNQGYAAYVMGVDVDAIGSTGVNYPGLLQLHDLMAIQTEAAATDNVTDVINSFAYYPTDGALWAFGSGLRLYKYVSGATWTKQRAGAGVDFPAGAVSSSAAKVINFRGILHVIYDDGYATWDNSTWTASANTFTAGTQSPRPSVILNDNLYIANGRYMSRIDDAGNFTAEAATLPEDYIIRSIDVFNNRIYISADNENLATIFVWDGISAESDRVENLENHSVAPIIKAVGGVLWVFATLPGSYQDTWIYTFNGSSFNKVFTLPFQISGAAANDGPAIYNGGLLFPTTFTSTGGYEGGTGGVWMLNRNSVGESWQITLPFNVGSEGQEQVTVGAVHASGRTVTVGVRDIAGADEYGIWGTTIYDNTAGEWMSLPIDAGDFTRNKTWHGIQVETNLPLQTYNADRNVTIYYRTSPFTSSWTELKTITRNTDPSAHLYIPIGVVSNTLSIRFKLGSAASSTGTTLRSFTLDYTLHPR